MYICIPAIPLLYPPSTGFLLLGNPLQVLSGEGQCREESSLDSRLLCLYWEAGVEGRAWHSTLSLPLAALVLHPQTTWQHLVSGYLGAHSSRQCQGSISSIGSSPSLKYRSCCRSQGVGCYTDPLQPFTWEQRAEGRGGKG